METILVMCGAGVSSTFLASRMRSLARSRELQVTATAASQDQLPDELPGVTALLVGPHLAQQFDELDAVSRSFGVPAALLPNTAFEPDGADAALDLAIALLRISHSTEGHPRG